MRSGFKFITRRFYFGWNGPIYWVHVSYGRVFSLTIGEKKFI